jgi:hypothetical protein
MDVRIPLTDEESDALIERAARNLRPVAMEAQFILRTQLKIAREYEPDAPRCAQALVELLSRPPRSEPGS